ncbi:uncharacterized protein LOC113516847 [Galleria mellonella]|uniref:Uncharacterized protein LOC113516847 n=1 Tax=Galleria mellonella TaxID=7137 RepID=A0A6J1WPC6_GALME|nr:uncharacterized protein LOC113516847 [Galleria mellonella]
MYTDDNYTDKESEGEDRSPYNCSSITKKSLSTVGFRNNIENQNVRSLAIRATQSFTGGVEELRLCGNFQKINLCNRINVSSPKVTTVCPCGCLLRPATTGPFRTREQNTLALHVVSPEVLNYHGYCYDPSQIAMFWKKDCRMFLWKGNAKMKNIIVADSQKNNSAF